MSETEYGRWEVGNMGTVGRTVTRYVEGLLGEQMPVVDWEDAPPEVEREYRTKYSDPSQPGGWKTLASFSAEDTARFFAGGDLGKPTIHDPETARKMAEQDKLLYEALYGVIVPALEDACRQHSPQTTQRLHLLANSPDKPSADLLGAMLGELLTQAIRAGFD